MLAVEPGDRLLEIGGGPGVAASLVCEQLDRGSLLLIDRSATAIERARRRNPEHVASGRLALETVDVADLDPGKGAV
jgi:ubiquinone/menaquinone biosynthesis C-methylase UbiE